MKKILPVIALVLSGFIFQTATAQLRVTVNANISTQPVWGPVGYEQADYYYMPDIDVFYNVRKRQYIYEQRGRWMFTASLPARYHNYDMYSGYKVVINEPSPYRRHEAYKVKYASYKGNRDQPNIRNSHDTKYFIIKGHPEHNKWQKDHNHDRKPGRGH